ncbi:signal peptidase I SipW [Neobacillus sp. SAB-20_R2A]|uniref:signal peptidase I SipW n=1 Tax=Neobacillus sp. SAB-20_R2A TaxID=3120519 RepID=UPI003C6DC745
MKSTKKWISRISGIFIYGVLLCMILMVISSKMAGDGGTPKVFGHEFMTVLSGSMEPGIKTGSIISVTPVADPTKFKKGDIITFKSKDDSNKLITHRIIEVQKVQSSVQYITKGDNNDSKDPDPVTVGRVVAQYDNFTIPFVGYALNFMKSKMGAVLLLIIPGVLIVGWSILSIWKTISSIEAKNENPSA